MEEERDNEEADSSKCSNPLCGKLLSTKAKTCPELAAGALDCKCDAKNTIHYPLFTKQNTKVIPVSSNNNDIA